MAVTGGNGRYIKHTAAGDGAGVKQSVYVKRLIWNGFSNAAHTLQVKDGSGNIVVPEFACEVVATTLGPIILDLDIRMDGIETDVLGSGSVIYLLG